MQKIIYIFSNFGKAYLAYKSKLKNILLTKQKLLNKVGNTSKKKSKYAKNIGTSQGQMLNHHRNMRHIRSSLGWNPRCSVHKPTFHKSHT